MAAFPSFPHNFRLVDMGEFAGFRHSFPQVTDGTNSSIGSLVFPPRRMHGVHVLLVERRADFVANGTSMVAEILKQFSYEGIRLSTLIRLLFIYLCTPCLTGFSDYLKNINLFLHF